MRKIKELAGHICEELDDACKYIDMALRYKDDDRELAEMYYNLSRGEVEHADLEHNQAVRIIKNFQGEVPPAMQAVWDFQHEKMIEDKANIKVRQSMYKE